jgi:Mg2+/Co2+ transporter CorB
MDGLGVAPQVSLWILIVVLLGCSAFFSGSETALMTVNRARLRQIAKRNRRGVKMVEGILEKPEKLISTILLGNNLVNVAMTAVATAIALSIWGDAGIVYVTVVLTVIILIFAELAPKVYARYHSERLSLITAPILKGIMTIFQPIIAGAVFLVRKLLLIVDIDITRTRRNIVTEGEVKTLINISWEDGSISAEEKDMLARIFTLNDRSVADVMVPKKRLVTLKSEQTIDQALKIIKRHGFSRYPVKDSKTQEIIGFIHAKDLLGKKRGNRKLRSMKRLIRPPYFISENKKINSQLRHFKSRRMHQAVVLNEQGDVTGLITLEDILEQMVGSIADEYDV